MMHDITIEKKDVRLTPMTLLYSQYYREIRNKDENRKWFLDGEVITSEMQCKWFRNYMENESDYMFAIWFDRRFIGGVAIYNIDDLRSCAEFGRLLIDNGDLRGVGIGTIVTNLTCKIAKKFLHLGSLYLEVKIDNKAAIRCYEKAGFIRQKCDENILLMDRIL